jgi:hypothetical protein
MNRDLSIIILCGARAVRGIMLVSVLPLYSILYISAVASQCFNASIFIGIIIDALPKVSFQKTKYWNKPVGLKHRIFNTYLGVSEEIQRPTTIATLMK